MRGHASSRHVGQEGPAPENKRYRACKTRSKWRGLARCVVGAVRFSAREAWAERLVGLQASHPDLGSQFGWLLAVLIYLCLGTPRRDDAAWARESPLHRTSSSRQLRVGPDLTVTLIGRSSAKDCSTGHVRRRRYRRRRPRSSAESRPSCAVPMRGSGPALHFGCCMEFIQARTLRLRLVWGAADRPTDRRDPGRGPASLSHVACPSRLEYCTEMLVSDGRAELESADSAAKLRRHATHDGPAQLGGAGWFGRWEAPRRLLSHRVLRTRNLS
jgi:hypothetical protein